MQNKQLSQALACSDEEEVACVDWRMDPDESYSDWKIEIFDCGTIHGSYHVHSVTPVVGPKQSEYFACLLANKSLKEHETHASCIEMEELAAKGFPLMLDYMYCLWGNAEIPITIENAVALHYFGRHFEIHRLKKKARVFWEKSRTIDQAATYLEHAMIFHDNQAYDAVGEKRATSKKVNSCLMEVSDAKFWLAVLRANKNTPSPALSSFVSTFVCSTHLDSLGAETFLELTNELTLPELSEQATMELLQLEQVFALTSDIVAEPSSLQERALDALTCNTGPLDLTQLQLSFNDVPSLVLEQMLQLSIANSQEVGERIDTVNGIYS